MFEKSIFNLPLPHINFSELLNQDFVIFGGTSLIGSSVGVVLNHFFCLSGDVKSLQNKREKARRKAESFRGGGR